jgi:AbrB family looped-hinge helix DNA binding protein
MATTRTRARQEQQTFQAKVTGRYTITLPPDLRRQLAIAPGDAVEIVVEGQQATLRKATEPAPPLKGLLRDYFTDWDDINRFIQEERSGWEERLKCLYPDDDASSS